MSSTLDCGICACNSPTTSVYRPNLFLDKLEGWVQRLNMSHWFTNALGPVCLPSTFNATINVNLASIIGLPIVQTSHKQ